MLLNILLFFVIGTIVGSFLNVVILRVDRLKTIFFTRSHCPNCQHQLGWKDLFPIFSFLYLKGRCRYCGKPISWQYPVVEAVTGLVFALLAWSFGGTAITVFYAIVFSFLIVVAVYDLKTQMIPEEFVWVALIITVLGSSFASHMDFKTLLIGGAVAGGLPALLVVISKEQWMGAGDIKLSLILGLLLGYPKAVIGMFMAFFLGAMVGVAYIYLGKKTMKDSLPFGPFLVTAAFLTVLFGNYILIRYFSFFNILY